MNSTESWTSVLTLIDPFIGSSQSRVLLTPLMRAPGTVELNSGACWRDGRSAVVHRPRRWSVKRLVEKSWQGRAWTTCCSLCGFPLRQCFRHAVDSAGLRSLIAQLQPASHHRTPPVIKLEPSRFSVFFFFFFHHERCYRGNPHFRRAQVGKAAPLTQSNTKTNSQL